MTNNIYIPYFLRWNTMADIEIIDRNRFYFDILFTQLFSHWQMI